MKLREKISSGVMKKVAVATALIAGFLAFGGAGAASAHPHVVVGVGMGAPMVVHEYIGLRPLYVAPRPYYGPVYVGPRYGYTYRHGLRVRYWDARFHCWRYR